MNFSKFHPRVLFFNQLGESKDIQAMLNLLEYNTKRDLVKLNPEKTEVINVSKALQTHPKKSQSLFNIYFPVFLVSYSKVLN
jgi:hypothetical protein